MSILNKFLPSVFRRSVARAEPVSLPPAQENVAQDFLAVPPHLDAEQAAKYHNVLLLLVPTENMAMSAYDDYYPGFYFALSQYETAKIAGVSEENYARVSASTYGAVAMGAAAHPLVQRFHDLRERMSDAIGYKKEDGRMIPVSLDAQAFMRAVQDNLDLLDAMKTLLETPIDKIRLYDGRAIVDGNLPLKADLAKNTRFGREYHNEFLDELLGFIDFAKANKPDLMAELIAKSVQNTPLPE